MKTLFFIESLSSGGKERRLVELIKGLQKYPGIEYELVLTKENIHYKEIFGTDIKTHYIVRKYFKKDPSLFFKFYTIVKNYKPDIIHVWGNMVAVYAIPSKILLNIPMINNQITDAPEERIVNKGILSHKLAFPFSDLIIANSRAGLESYNAPVKKSVVIYNGFDFNRIKKLTSPNEIRKKFNITTKHVIGMIASFSDYKDYETYIKAANQVLREGFDITFLCVGAGEDKYYQALVDDKYEKQIKFLGRQEKVESIMNICDIGVLSTRTEGISNALVEFMALGKPVIATDGGGTKELIVDGETGYLIPPKSPGILADKMVELINNPLRRKMFGEDGAVRIKRKFNIDIMISSFINMYAEVIGKY